MGLFRIAQKNMCAGYQLFTTMLATKIDTLFVQGWVYNICPKPYVGKGFSKRHFKKPFSGKCCTIVVPFYSGFLAGVANHQFFDMTE